MNERSSFFEAAYESGAPWDIGRPQPELVALDQAGAIRGSVLDAGCGTGDNALFLAEVGHEVVGIDFVPAAIERARDRAARRGLPATFRVLDALKLPELGRTFDTVVDSGLFHTFDDDERPRFVAALAQVLRPGGIYHLLCFSERETREGGPRRVTQAEIRAAFADGWRVSSIREARFASRIHDGGARAWLASIERT